MRIHSVILHNVRSTHNVGAIFRTADGAGAREIILCGYTPAPIDRFGRKVGAIAKTSLGACGFVPWRHAADINSLIAALQASGVRVVAVEQASVAESLFDFKADTRPVAFVFGNEITGIDPEILALVDQVIELPMLGQKESLNVAVTVGIVLYHALFASVEV